MSGEALSRELALRIGLAARMLPDTDPQRLVRVLMDAVGLPFTMAKLEKITVKDLKTAADGELNGVETEYLKQAVRCLWGEVGDPSGEVLQPKPVAYQEGEMPGSIRVACASNTGEMLDGHFGSCARFLIYQVSQDEARLVDVRAAKGEGDADKNAFRAGLLFDCQVLYVQSIGGPAAAKVVRGGVHPIKWPDGGEAGSALKQLQDVLGGSPPPWLAKVMGVDAEARVKDAREAWL